MINPWLALPLATIVMLATTKIALDTLVDIPGSEQSSVLIMITGSLLALSVALGAVDWSQLS
jgi:Na+/H+ antiporter NhaC